MDPEEIFLIGFSLGMAITALMVIVVILLMEPKGGISKS
jgi:hypothetical protein